MCAREPSPGSSPIACPLLPRLFFLRGSILEGNAGKARFFSLPFPSTVSRLLFLLGSDYRYAVAMRRMRDTITSEEHVRVVAVLVNLKEKNAGVSSSCGRNSRLRECELEQKFSFFLNCTAITPTLAVFISAGTGVWANSHITKAFIFLKCSV